MKKLRALATIPILCVACCAPAPEPAPPPVVSQPAPTPTPAPPPVIVQPTYDNWLDAPQTAGDWTYRTGGNQSFADYYGSNGTHLFQLNCTADRDIILSTRTASTSGRIIQLRTETLERAISADAGEGWISTRLSPRDPVLAAMAFSRGRFAVETPGARTLYLPAWPEVTRAIEDCR